MSISKANDFMIQLQNQLISDKKVSESTANQQVKMLVRLNGGQPFRNLAFLKQTEAVLARIEAYAESTKRSILAAITSVLSLFMTRAGFKNIQNFYYNKTNEKIAESKKNATGEKTEKQKENWVSWEDVKKTQESLEKQVTEGLTGKKNITPMTQNNLLSLVVLSLQTELPPRRNKDYSLMSVVRATKKTNPETLPKDTNQLVVENKVPTKFIFNVQKTQKQQGQQIIEIPSEGKLRETLEVYLNQHPLKKEKGAFALLVDSNGKPLVAVNAITRILNRIFGKKVGSSLLRHIYISNKYGDVKPDLVDDSNKMAHSIQAQQSVQNVS